jgi:hypothetical protein
VEHNNDPAVAAASVDRAAHAGLVTVTGARQPFTWTKADDEILNSLAKIGTG